MWPKRPWSGEDDIRDPEPPKDRYDDGSEWDEFDEWYDRQKDKEVQPQ